MAAEKPPVDGDVLKPKEGTTGWSDTWMIYSKAAHPNCTYLWMNYIISPEANAKVAEWFGEAPSNSKACDYTTDPNHCDDFHATRREPGGRTSTSGTRPSRRLRRRPR